VFTANTRTDVPRRFVLAQSHTGTPLRIYEEKGKVLFEVPDLNDRPSLSSSIQVLGVTDVSAASGLPQLRIWYIESGGAFAIQDVTIEPTAEGSRLDAVRYGDVRTLAAEDTQQIAALASFPSDILRWADETRDTFVYVAITDDAVVVAESADGLSNWQTRYESAQFRAQLADHEGLAGQRIVDLTVQPIPMIQHGTSKDVLLVLLATRDNDAADSDDARLYLLTLVLDASANKMNLHYHEQLRIRPTQFLEDGPPVGNADCSDGVCSIDPGFSAMALDEQTGVLTLYVPTSVDESFPPIMSPMPKTCGVSNVTRALPTEKLWRRLLLKLDRAGEITELN